MSRLVFRPHPEMVRAAWVRGRPPRRTAGHRDRMTEPPTCSSTAARSSTGPARRAAGPVAVAATTGCALAAATTSSGAAASAPIDATGHGRRARASSTSTATAAWSILAEPRHEPKVRQGVTTEVIGVDGNALRAVPAPRGPRGVRRPQRRPRRPARRSPTTGDGRRVPRPLRRRGQRQHRVRWSATRRSGSRRSAGTTSTADAAALATGCARSCARRWRRARSGCRPGSTTRPAPTPRPTSWPRSRPRPARLGGFYHTHVRYPLGDRFLDPFREAIEIGRRGGAPGPHHPLLSPGDVPGHARSRCSRWSTTPGPRASTSPSTPIPHEWASTRLLISCRTWIQAGGAGAAEGAPRRPRGARPDPRRDGGARRGRTPAQRAGPTSGSGTSRRPEHLRWEGRTLGESWRETGRDAVDAICDLLLAEDLRRQPGHARAAPAGDPRRSSPTRVGMVGTDGAFIGAKPSPRTYGSVPAHPRRVRARRAAAQPRGGRPQDDGGAGGAARPARSRARSRDGARGGHRRLRPGDGPVATRRTTSRASSRSASSTSSSTATLVVDGGEHTGATPGRGHPARARLTPSSSAHRGAAGRPPRWSSVGAARAASASVSRSPGALTADVVRWRRPASARCRARPRCPTQPRPARRRRDSATASHDRRTCSASDGVALSRAGVGRTARAARHDRRRRMCRLHRRRPASGRRSRPQPPVRLERDGRSREVLETRRSPTDDRRSGPDGRRRILDRPIGSDHCVDVGLRHRLGSCRSMPSVGRGCAVALGDEPAASSSTPASTSAPVHARPARRRRPRRSAHRARPTPLRAARSGHEARRRRA